MQKNNQFDSEIDIDYYQFPEQTQQGYSKLYEEAMVGNFIEIHPFSPIYISPGKDNRGNRVAIINSYKISTSAQTEDLIKYFNLKLNSIRQGFDLQSFQLVSMYKQLPSEYKKNLMGMYIVGADAKLKTALGNAKPFLSDKFNKKIVFIEYIRSLDDVASPFNVRLPLAMYLRPGTNINNQNDFTIEDKNLSLQSICTSETDGIEQENVIPIVILNIISWLQSSGNISKGSEMIVEKESQSFQRFYDQLLFDPFMQIPPSLHPSLPFFVFETFLSNIFTRLIDLDCTMKLVFVFLTNAGRLLSDNLGRIIGIQELESKFQTVNQNKINSTSSSSIQQNKDLLLQKVSEALLDIPLYHIATLQIIILLLQEMSAEHQEQSINQQINPNTNQNQSNSQSLLHNQLQTPSPLQVKSSQQTQLNQKQQINHQSEQQMDSLQSLNSEDKRAKYKKRLQEQQKHNKQALDVVDPNNKLLFTSLTANPLDDIIAQISQNEVNKQTNKKNKEKKIQIDSMQSIIQTAIQSNKQQSNYHGKDSQYQMGNSKSSSNSQLNAPLKHQQNSYQQDQQQKQLYTPNNSIRPSLSKLCQYFYPFIFTSIDDILKQQEKLAKEYAKIQNKEIQQKIDKENENEKFKWDNE